MKIRRRTLPTGWYPSKERELRSWIDRISRSVKQNTKRAVACIVPHAGWEYSGKIAFETLSQLVKSAQTVVVVGGHLSSYSGILAASEEGYETPLGAIDADLGLLSELKRRMSIEEDRHTDNTVEVQLPFIRYLYPSACVLWMRASPSEEAMRLGVEIRESATALRKSVVVVGSTDLTHYGYNYGFTPHGTGDAALKWVKEVNDQRFIESIMECNFQDAINRALQESSACSAGGAIAAGSFAKSGGIDRGTLVSYMTSGDVFPSDSFVGYAGIVYQSG